MPRRPSSEWIPRRPRLAGLVAACLVLLPGLAVEAADRALVVGIDTYGDPRVPDTPGGADDARSVARTLERDLGFSAEEIRVLVDAEATSDAIVQEFQSWLVEGSGPGDRVFFLYAGHGSQLPDQDGDEDDGYDETLAPYDVEAGSGRAQIRDDVIDSLIAQLSGRRAILVFDSCHSGTLTRSLAPTPASTGGGGVRYLPRPDQIARMERNRRTVGGGGTATYRVEAVEGGDPRPFDRPGQVARMSGIVAISAAHPGQLAYPVEVDGVPRGALTYLFEQAVRPDAGRGLLEGLAGEVLESTESTLTQAAGDAVSGGLSDELGAATATGLGEDVTVATLETLLEKGMVSLQESGRLEGSQRPFFEVISEEPIEQEPLFGTWETAAATALSNPVSDRRVDLRTVGDRALFHRGETIAFDVTSNRPGYLYLLVFSEGGTATCIFPNPLDRKHRIGATPLRVPTHPGYELPAREPFGRDVVVALVADDPLPLCEKVDYTWSEIFSRVRLDEIHRRLQETARRGIGVRPAHPPATAAENATIPAWQSATLVLHTVDAPASEVRP